MMRQAIAAAVLVLAASTAAAGQAGAQAAKEELDRGATAYRRGDFAEAQRRFERALELDPANKNLPLFIARSIQQQYKPGVADPENVAKGMQAVAAYERILERDPANEDAYQAILYLHGQMKNEEALREMLLRRANDGSAPDEKRAAALTILASKQWQCSYDITELKENKETQTPGEKENKENKENKETQAPGGKVVVKYKRPADASAFLRAQQCVAEGLILSEQATRLDPDNPNSWSYRANLLREASKLAEMEDDSYQKAEYDRQYADALERHRAASAQGRHKTGPPVAGDVPPPPRTLPLPAESGGGTPPRRSTVVPAGVLNAKAISKPEPAYPPAAKAARAQVVTVRVRVDEEGKVIEANAVSGHPLLRPAAVEAARRARFPPTLLKGQPVQVSGVLTYHFVPE
ncbi:MAG: TonB family protein [Acidobacteriota bacterium]|nr:TonB family protein [Acidobacteriota bacterium]